MINVIGAGLAGCEAAWQLAERGITIKLYEMKPKKMSPAHKSENFAELVCSNSLRADGLHNAVGLLKEELRKLDSIIMSTADVTKVPAGGALAVDRDGFSAAVTEKIKAHPNIKVIHEEVTTIPSDCPTIIAAGPLASDALAEEIAILTGKQHLHFFDAAAPIVTKESVDFSSAFYQARYDKGGDDYINCPMTKDEYLEFYHNLIEAQLAPLNENVDKPNVFEGCMPVETMAKRGEDTLRFGPLKPVGLTAPDGTRPYAVVQLRQDNADGTLYNLVGFQTRLTFGEQSRVFSLIPALRNAEFVRFGVMHRNTYIDSPQLLDNTFKYKDGLYFAGQITGVEGYVESTASGLLAGINMAHEILGKPPMILPRTTALGALAAYISNQSITDFQPMNINFGIMEPLERKIRDKREKALAISKKSLNFLEDYAKMNQI
ncbi:MAG: methylenetetrahydrofolate--tRNA-(uracil(54)-C(5))-methyltransferase (FADH(2)-oxidizing) TrmFO [Oscillospiraceae bacterium]|nr:methylenetetrahydrofolate--tRNA-(uracil(54)-C(5))-methyltransferase (FADH(2)-oxidizing) TrmFO [Oscillospiraceae bacterium]